MKIEPQFLAYKHAMPLEVATVNFTSIPQVFGRNYLFYQNVEI